MAQDEKKPDETAASETTDAELTEDQLEKVAGGAITDGTSNTFVLGDGSVREVKKIQGLFHNY